MIIFIDTETTGIEKNDKICSIGLIVQDKNKIKYFYDLVNENKKISPKASSLNRITNEMLKDKTSLVDSKTYKFLDENNSQENILIGHDINLHLGFLKEYGFLFKGAIIDTKRVSKHLMQECEYFNLQFLRYELKLYRDDEKNSSELGINLPFLAYNALYDSILVKSLYEYLLEMKTSKIMQELSFKKVLLEKFEFGKYEGRYIEEISTIDREYLFWMLENIQNLDEDLHYSLEYYLRENGI